MARSRYVAQIVLFDGRRRVVWTACLTSPLHVCRTFPPDSRSDRKRLGAIIFFTEIFSHDSSRAVVARHLSRTVHSLWDSALQDHKLEIREAGKLALEVCVANMPLSDALVHRDILFEDVLAVLDANASGAHAVHGALLTACVLAKTVEDGDTSLLLLWPAVLRVKDKDLQSSRAAMEFMNIAAEKSPVVFLRKWLQPTMTWLCDAMKRERDQNAGESFQDIFK